jgi:hypothetical protein
MRMRFSILLCLLLTSWAGAVTNTWQVGKTNTNWSSADNWDQGHKPAAGEDVVMAAALDCVVNEATAALNSLDMTGYTGTLSGANNITVTVASGTSVVKFAGTNPTWSGTLNLNPAAGTTINLTMGSLTTAGTIGGITIAGTTTGAVYFLDGVTMGATKVVTLTSGTLHTDGASDNSGLTHSWGLFSSSGALTRTLTMGTSTIGITGTGSAWDMSTNTNLTVSANTATITLSGTNITTWWGIKTYGGLVAFTGSGAATIKGGGDDYFNNLTRTGTNAKTDSFIDDKAGNLIVTGTLAINGNSPTNRLLVYAGTFGTSKTITTTSATVSVDNVDFRDITFQPATSTGRTIASVADDGGGLARFTTSTAHGLIVGNKITITGTTNYNGNKTITAVNAVNKTFDTGDAYVSSQAGTWTYDLTNNGANLIGDCGGNTGATFTTSRVSNFINVAGGNWADVANWDTATDADRVPLPQDDVTFATAFNSGVTITANMPRLGRSIDFSGATATGAGVLPTFALGNAVTNYGSLNLTGLKASGFSGNYSWYFESQARSGTNTLTSNGKTLGNSIGLFVKTIGTTFQLGDALLSTGAGYLEVDNGTFVDAGFSVSVPRFFSSTATTRAVTKTGDWTLTYIYSATYVMELAASGLTWSDTGGTITISGTDNSAKTFAGTGKTFNNLTIAGGGTGAIIFTGNNTFRNTVTPDAPGTGVFTVNYPKTIQFADGSITSASTWVMSGAAGAGNTVTIRPVTDNGTQHFHIAKTGGGTAVNDYLVVTNSVADTVNTFYYGANGSADAYSLAHGWAASASNGAPVRNYLRGMQNQ